MPSALIPTNAGAGTTVFFLIAVLAAVAACQLSPESPAVDVVKEGDGQTPNVDATVQAMVSEALATRLPESTIPTPPDNPMPVLTSVPTNTPLPSTFAVVPKEGGGQAPNIEATVQAMVSEALATRLPESTTPPPPDNPMPVLTSVPTNTPLPSTFAVVPKEGGGQAPNIEATVQAMVSEALATRLPESTTPPPPDTPTPVFTSVPTNTPLPSTFAVVPSGQAPFALSWEISTSEVEAGESFILSVRMHGIRQVGEHGGISISFPSLTEPAGSKDHHSSSAAEINALDYSSGLSNVTFHQPGATIYHRNNNRQFPAEYLLVESDDASWTLSDDRTLSLRITPRVGGYFPMQIRGWLCADGYTDCVRQPSSGSEEDQQSWAVGQALVNVNVPPKTEQTPLPSTFAVVPSGQAPFALSWEISTSEVEAGESFILSVRMHGIRQVGEHGGISISFPSLTEPAGSKDHHSSSAAEINALDYSSGLSNVTFHQPGATIYHRNNNRQFPAEYLLVESDDASWTLSDDRTLSLRITPRVGGYFPMQIRGWLCADGYTDCVRQPSSGSEEDQQGWAVGQALVNVNMPTSISVSNEICVSEYSQNCKLALRYAPVLRMHPEERFLPQGVEAFINRARLMAQDGDKSTPEQVLGQDEITIANVHLLASEGYNEEFHYLDVPDNFRDVPQYEYPPTVYATIRGPIGDRIYIQYYLFYYYDHPNPGPLQAGCERLGHNMCLPHEADWELIQLEFFANNVGMIIKEESEPTTVAYSQHGWSEDSAYRDISTIGRHPVAYVSLGKHANYFGPPDSTLYVSIVRDHISDQGKELLPLKLYPHVQPCRNARADELTPCSYELQLITDQTPWVAYGGRWGDKKIDGPDQDIRWNNPYLWSQLGSDLVGDT